MKTHRLAILITLFAIALAGCKGCKEGCTNPTALNYDADATRDCCCEFPTKAKLKIKFHHRVNGNPFAYSQSFDNGSGRMFDITLARFYMSNITLHRASGNFKFTDDTCTTNHFLLVTPDQQTYDVGEFDPGSYTGISFTVGVDTVVNKTVYPAEKCVVTTTGHVLQNSDMHWGWNMGYIFLKLEGHADTTDVADGTLDGVMVYHTGTNPLARTAMVDYNFSGVKEGTVTLDIIADYGALLNGIDLANDYRSHTDPPRLDVAIQVMNNASGMFSKL